MDTAGNMMGIPLSSPFVMASLTPVSHVDLESHRRFYLSAIAYGAGAVILPSINPLAGKNAGPARVAVRTRRFFTGLNGNDPMGYSLLGPTDNLLSSAYIVKLAASLRPEMKSATPAVPLIASVANIGDAESFITVIRQLEESGLFDGIELNFSCPNVHTGINLLTYDVIARIRSRINLPFAIKLKPGVNTADLREILTLCDGLTLSNAYRGLEGPQLSGGTERFFSPYDTRQHWSPAGVYGPFQRLLTYYDLFSSYTQLGGEKPVSCVGGIVAPEHAIQAILLGADTVQLSSALAWNGLCSFADFKRELVIYMQKHGVKSLNDLRGGALSSIVSEVDSLDKSDWRKRTASITGDCRKCRSCDCCGRLCVAFSMNQRTGVPEIDKRLCSGCGWCLEACKFGAVSMEYDE
jgi:dihydroorotate dehydrogenase/Pyruvate/2-oxoacid:ferredoxin oxidoreductase delta subunit